MNATEEIIGRVKDRFNELKEKGFDWRSFYNGWLEGCVDLRFKSTPTTNTGSMSLQECKDEWLHKMSQILELCDKLPKEANYFGTVDKIKWLCRKHESTELDGILSRVGDALSNTIATLSSDTKQSELEQSRQPLNQWISVQERLPDHSRRVLVYCTDEHTRIDQYTKYPGGLSFVYGGVTHWCELPTPPQQ